MPCLLVCFLAIASTTRPMLWSPHTISYDTKPRGFIPYTTYAIQYSTVQYTQRQLFRVGRWTDVSSSGLHKPSCPFSRKLWFLQFWILRVSCEQRKTERQKETKNRRRVVVAAAWRPPTTKHFIHTTTVDCDTSFIFPFVVLNDRRELSFLTHTYTQRNSAAPCRAVCNKSLQTPRLYLGSKPALSTWQRRLGYRAC